MTKLNRLLLAGLIALAGASLSLEARAAEKHATAPKLPANIKGTDGMKAYLMTVLDGVNKAARDLKTAGQAYDALIKANGGTPESAAKAKPKEVAALILQMRDAFQRIDSFGYEYVEGIVAGVPTLSKYDVELDAGIPAKGSKEGDDVAQVVIKAGPLTLDKEGSLNNFLIEPTVFGTNERFTQGTATLPGFDKPVGLPNPALVLALADYAIDGYDRLTKDAKAWKPSDTDSFAILINMTPTFADYFEDWKESKINGAATGGRFVAVSRVSDMRGIMSSTRLAWLSVDAKVREKDKALADKISKGYDEILTFIDSIEAREAKGGLTADAIDALGSQAKEKADKLTVQSQQAAAILGLTIDSK